jgi:hypothetical protein
VVFATKTPLNPAAHAGEPIGDEHEKTGATFFAPNPSPSQSGNHSAQVCPAWQFAPGASGLEHVPLAGSQVPATWQLSLAVQTTALHGLPSVAAPPPSPSKLTVNEL